MCNEDGVSPLCIAFERESVVELLLNEEAKTNLLVFLKRKSTSLQENYVKKKQTSLEALIDGSYIYIILKTIMRLSKTFVVKKQWIYNFH